MTSPDAPVELCLTCGTPSNSNAHYFGEGQSPRAHEFVPAPVEEAEGPRATIRCTICRSEFTDEQIEGANSCPTCQRQSVPERISEDVTVTINWHELRILGMWAENWAIKNDDASMVHTVRVITSLLQQQHPEKSSLTMSGELRDLRHAVEDKGGSIQLSDPRFYVPDEGIDP